MTTQSPGKGKGLGILDFIEWTGNKLPDPATLFMLGAVLVMVISYVAKQGDWTVKKEKPVQATMENTDADGNVTIEKVFKDNGEPEIVWVDTGERFKATSLLSRDGLYWAISKMVTNFTSFAPLGVVLVGMLGIGIAERVGLISALLKGIMLFVPGYLLTPTMVFVGVMSSMTLDAGYVVLPPLAAALYKAAGRSPLAGIAAVFAGVSAGFNANLLPTGLDPMLAGFATSGARTVDPEYVVNPLCNWYFMAVSTIVITLAGWAVTSFFVERRLENKSPDEGGPIHPSAEELAEHKYKPEELRGLTIAGLVFVVTFGIVLLMVLLPKAPLHSYYMPDSNMAELYNPEIHGPILPANGYINEDGVQLVPSTEHFARWVDAIVPILFFCFIIPAIAYGMVLKVIRSDKDVAKMLIESMAAMAPIIVLAFFAAQFTEYFKYSGLDKMLAQAGGQTLGKSGLSPYSLMIAFILVTLVFNLFVGSMSAKYAMFAPIFIPMFMYANISPELTQAAYRIGDSVSNIITPLNAYLVIILVFMQKYVPKSGMGTLISTMVPYTIVFTIIWTILLMVWMAFDIPLGPGGGLTYQMVGG